MVAETEKQRQRRECRRVLFGNVASLYDATRQGYSDEVVDAFLTTAKIGPGASVLEIGCGTGQLTAKLAGRGLNVTAIDIGIAMVATAQRNVSDPMVGFEVSSFEDFQGTRSFDLIVSATAFHWVDPEIGWSKAADLLRPNGWLALLTTGESYPEPLRTSLRQLWIKYSRERVKWTPRPPWYEPLREMDLFGDVVEVSWELALRLPVDTVLGVECTRATFLSFGEADRVGFAADLKKLLETIPYVALTQETFLAMAPVAGSAPQA